MADTSTDRLDRHALVMAIWTPSAFVAAILAHTGIASEAAPEVARAWIAAAFAAVILAFVGHVIVNTVLKTGFTAGETALGLVAFATALLTLLLTVLTGSDDLVQRIFLPVGVGLMALVVAVIAYLVIRHGPRGAFEKFDVIRDNNLRPASRLPHRGGRR
ncbi:hypothetical protein [Pseudohoeflea coraliihabitans]|uniref:Uncharacterized protein n=1 Tax=Pseudohoeflea coraliihabitans TaxID=2860393 RepID=A0ABS6WSL9_9HYPH|nr:hypothetical protein [Pseudohoeflea sp. DP4N28-3]MBW3098957.1 hypothetical protein [Pseudohoeflea sp. DP4N28-3]